VVDARVCSYNLKSLLCAVVEQGVLDYRFLKSMGYITNGLPDNLAMAKAPQKLGKGLRRGDVPGTCGFIWDGWLERLLESAELNIEPTVIYEELEPELWTKLLTLHN
jgi:hypothetical protein